MDCVSQLGYGQTGHLFEDEDAAVQTRELLCARPEMPSIVQEPKVTAVMGDDRQAPLRREEQLMRVRGSEPTLNKR